MGAGGSRNEQTEGELRRYKAEVERLDNELRRETIRAEELSSDLNALRQTTVSVGRERDLEAKIDRIQREADSNYKKLQVI
jgi:archaellum component FlaC